MQNEPKYPMSQGISNPCEKKDFTGQVMKENK